MLLNQLRFWLIQQRIGLITEAELIRRCDHQISVLDDPPDYLVSLSLREDLFHIPRLDLIKEPLDDLDASLLAKELLSLLQREQITISQIYDLSLRTRELMSVNTHTAYEFILMEEACVGFFEGYTDSDSCFADIREHLQEIIDETT